MKELDITDELVDTTIEHAIKLLQSLCGQYTHIYFDGYNASISVYKSDKDDKEEALPQKPSRLSMLRMARTL